MLRELAALVVATERGSRLRVAVDGVDCSGKTTLADRLAEAIRPDRPVVRASIDGFHLPRAIRYRHGRESPEGCYRDTFDLTALRERLLEPFAGGQPCETAVFDLTTDRPVNGSAVQPAPDAVLVVDGVFLQRPELAGAWDLVVHLQVGDDEVLRRAAVRDGLEALRLYRSRYLPAHRLYEAECAPAVSADVVVDNTDATRPVVARWSPPQGSPDGTLTP